MPDLDAALSDSLLALLLAEGSWEQFLNLLISDQSISAAMFMQQKDRLSGCGGHLSIVTGLEDSTIREYSDYYARLNPWLTDQVLYENTPRAWRDYDATPREKLHQSEYFNDYLRPLGFEGGAWLTLSKREGRVAVLGAVTGDPSYEIPTMLLQRILGIQPLLLRVLDYYRRPDLGMIAAEQVLEVLSSALCLFGREGRILHLSPGAEALARTLDLFEALPLGAVRLRPDSLQQAREEMQRWDYAGPPHRVIRLRDCRLTLFRASRDTMNELLCGPSVGLLIEPARNWLDQQQEQELQRRYALTTAEMRALRGIAAGATIQEMAESNGRSVETLRSQVKSLLCKTGCATQLQLVHFLRSL